MENFEKIVPEEDSLQSIEKSISYFEELSLKYKDSTTEDFLILDEEDLSKSIQVAWKLKGDLFYERIEYTKHSNLELVYENVSHHEPLWYKILHNREYRYERFLEFVDSHEYQNPYSRCLKNLDDNIFYYLKEGLVNPICFKLCSDFIRYELSLGVKNL